MRRKRGSRPQIRRFLNTPIDSLGWNPTTTRWCQQQLVADPGPEEWPNGVRTGIGHSVKPVPARNVRHLLWLLAKGCDNSGQKLQPNMVDVLQDLEREANGFRPRKTHSYRYR